MSAGDRQNTGGLPPLGLRANAGKGRVKGVPNKNTALLKDMILKALEQAGGVAYLAQQAEANPGPFMTLVGKVLPMQIAGDPDGSPVRHTISLADAPEVVLRYLATQEGKGDE